MYPNERGVYTDVSGLSDDWAGADVWSRGLFYFNTPKGFNNITDGLSNTIAVSESIADDNPSMSKVKGSVAYWYVQRVDAVTGERLWSPSRSQTVPRSGGRFSAFDVVPGRCNGYLNSGSIYTGFNTILPPNEVSAASIWLEDTSGFFTANSGHTGGVNCGLADGSVHFVTNNVDTGGLPDAPQGKYLDTPKPTHPNFAYAPASPYGIWGTMGTPSAGETAALP
jgi:hypothetical protein